MSLTVIILCAVIGFTSGAGVLPADSVNAAVKGSVTFTTSLTPAENPLSFISWNFGTTNILTILNGTNDTHPEYEGRITVIVSTGSLMVRNVSLNDTGEYSVTIRTTAGDPTVTGNTTLNVYEPVSYVAVSAANTDLVEFNDSATIYCFAEGSSLSFDWYKGSAPVSSWNRVYCIQLGILIITPVRRYHQGPHICRVSNPVSSLTGQIRLSISYGPESVELVTSGEYYEEGSDVILYCLADSRPGAQFKWFLNGATLLITGARINLMNIQMDQSGNYSCQAFNSKTLRYKSSKPAPVSVLKKITNISVKPSPERPVEGKSLDLTCDASGSIFTRVWLINGKELYPSENIVFSDQKRVLSFRVLNRFDNGKYTCNISNPVSSQSVDYTLNAKTGLSAGAIAGITVASLVVVAGAAAGGFYVYKKKK